jgi:hypothetical protein
MRFPGEAQFMHGVFAKAGLSSASSINGNLHGIRKNI